MKITQTYLNSSFWCKMKRSQILLKSTLKNCASMYHLNLVQATTDMERRKWVKFLICGITGKKCCIMTTSWRISTLCCCITKTVTPRCRSSICWGLNATIHHSQGNSTTCACLCSDAFIQTLQYRANADTPLMKKLLPACQDLLCKTIFSFKWKFAK